MKIAIDISQVIYQTGVSHYTKSLVENLLAIDSKNEYILFGGSLRRKSELRAFTSSLKGNFKAKLLPISPNMADLIWNRLHRFPVEKFIGKHDILHSSDWAQPPSRSFKVTTVHDLAPIRFPHDTHPQIVAVHTRRLAWVKKEVDRVIVPSQSTLKDLVDYGISQEKVRVIPEAPREIFKKQPNDKVNNLKKRLSIPGNYLLSVGVGGRKNTKRIIEAFDKIRAGKNLSLVLVGRSFQSIPEQRGVRAVGHVPDALLPTLYSGAKALVYPSLYEGFGLPILEAFSCGLPVVTSNISSMPEVAGNAAVLVDPNDTNSIAEGIKVAIKKSRELASLGRKRAKEFSWLQTAAKTLEVYNEGRRQ